MRRKGLSGLLSLGAIAILAGCQHAIPVQNYRVLQPDAAPTPASLSCRSSHGCMFFKVDGIPVIDEKTKQPTRTAIEKSMLRLEGSVFAADQYAVALSAKQHEIVVNFYPVSTERSERFYLIHSFAASQNYQLVMYRQKQAKNGSLLNVAMPGKLCVDLTQNEIVIRRFCRPFDVVTGMGEFVEEPV